MPTFLNDESTSVKIIYNGETTPNELIIKGSVRLKTILSEIPGIKFDKKLQVWACKANYTISQQIFNILTENNITIEWDNKTKEFMELEYDRILKLYNYKTECFDRPKLRGWPDLSDLQMIGTNWLAQSEGALLSDEMGSGKTVMACVALNAIRPEQTLVICPNSVKQVWYDHIKQWTPLKPILLEGTASQRHQQIRQAFPKKYVVIICSWNQIKLHSRLKRFGPYEMSEKDKQVKEFNLFNFDVCIADEAHKMKDPKSKQTRAVWSIQAKQKWALTGTPIANSPLDLWSILHYISPEDWPSRTKFLERYCVKTTSVFGGVSATALSPDTRDEFDSLTQYRILRRQKHEIMGRKILKNRMTRLVELSPKHRDAYNSLRDHLIAKLSKESILTAANRLAVTVRLTQMSCAMLDIEVPEELDEIDLDEEAPKVVMKKPSPKIEGLMDLLEDLGDEPIVVFSASKQLVNLTIPELHKAGISFVAVTGDTDEEQRALNVEKFQQGKARVFIGTTGSCGEGITLTKAKYLCFMQRPWSMVQNLQAEDRIHRWGQISDEVTIIDILSKNTIDSRIQEVFSEKRGRLQDLTRDELIDLM